jgi:phage-related protein (TIGR01555 family)
MSLFSRVGAALAAPFRRSSRADSADSAPARARGRRADGWGNVITGLGGFKDKRLGGYNTVDIVVDIQARDMWRGDDIAKRVIEMLPMDSMRRGYVIKTKEKEISEAIAGAAEDLRFDSAVRKADMYERAYGGSAIFPIIHGATGDLGKPLNEDAITKVLAFHVLEPRELYPVRWYGDLLSPKFGMPETYRCIPLFSGGAMATPIVEIHESRLIIFPGIRVTRLPQAGALLGWGDNVLTAMSGVLRDFGLAWGTAAALLQDFSQAVMQIEGLDQIAVNDQGNVAQARLQQIMMLRSFMNAVVIDTKDKFSRQQTPMNGLADLLQQFATRLAAAAGMPVTKLMGMSPAGLNATGESDTIGWDDSVSGHQAYLTPMVEHGIRLITKSSEGPTDGEEPDQWSIEWRPLRSPTEKDIALTRLSIAQADDLNIKNQIYSGEDAARSHYGGDTYSYDIVIDWKEREAQQKAIEDADAQAAQLALMPGAPGAPAIPGTLGAGAAAPGGAAGKLTPPPRRPAVARGGGKVVAAGAAGSAAAAEGADVPRVDPDERMTKKTDGRSTRSDAARADFDPDQPRDDRGRFGGGSSSGGEHGAGAASSKAAAASEHASAAAHEAGKHPSEKTHTEASGAHHAAGDAHAHAAGEHGKGHGGEGAGLGELAEAVGEGVAGKEAVREVEE